MTATAQDPGVGARTGWRAEVRSFVETEVRPHARAWAAAGRVDRGLWERAGAAGLLGVDVPVGSGGAGRDFAAEVVVTEELARAGDTAWGHTAHEVVAQLVLTHGTDAQRERWLAELSTGRTVGAIAVTEPGAGSDVASLAATAVRDGDGYRLDAHKAFVTNGLHAGLVATAALVDGEPGVLLVDTDRVPVLREPVDKIGRHGQDTADLRIGGRLPADAVLGGTARRGAAGLASVMSRERLLVAVSAVATMETVLDATVRRCNERRIGGKPLRRLQNTRFVLADCAVEVAAGRAFVDAAVAGHRAGTLGVPDAAAVKLWATERLAVVADRCLQLFGGVGYTPDCAVARAWADARVTRVYGGASEVMRELVAAALPHDGERDRDGGPPCR